MTTEKRHPPPALHESAENVTLFLNGSCPDFAAAFNHDHDLVQNSFIHCHAFSKEAPLKFLDIGFQKIPMSRAFAGDGGRFIGCTAPFVHPAGRNIYRKGIADFHALQPAEAERLGIADSKIALFDFIPISVKPKEPHESLEMELKGAPSDSPVKVFHRPVTDPDYRSVMESVLTNPTAELGKKTVIP